MAKTNGRPPFGYKHGSDGYFEIDEPHAAIIRRIYNEHLKQTSIRQICRSLNEEGIKSSRGVTWDHSVVTHILKNKIYCGSENIEGIISEEEFIKTQELRLKKFEKVSGPENKEDVWKYKYPFTSIIICGQCGEKYTRAVQGSGRRCERRVWKCKTYFKKGVSKCNNTCIPEKQLKEAFIRAFNKLQKFKEQFLEESGNVDKDSYNNKELDILFDESIEMLREASINRSPNIKEVNENAVILLQKKIEYIWNKVEFDEQYYNNIKLKERLNEMPFILEAFDEDIFKKNSRKDNSGRAWSDSVPFYKWNLYRGIL